MNKWQDPALSLGERCVAFAENEMANGVGEDSHFSYTSPRLKEYFNICSRLINGKETHISFTAGNWCAAGVSFCLHESLLSGEKVPHGYRLGVVEVVSDLQRNRLYRSIDQVRSGIYQIKIGDPIIFDRSDPKNPASSWWRHIGRVYSVDDKQFNFKCISGNNGGKWRLSSHMINQPNLLGFGDYPSAVAIQEEPAIMDWSNINIEALAPLEDTGKNLEAEFFDSFKDIFKG